MEPLIILLDQNTDQTAKKMLQSVVDRKKKYDLAKHKHILTLWAAMIMCFMLISYIYLYIAVPYSYSFFSMFVVFFGNFYHLIFLAATGGLLGYMTLLQKKKDKAEKEFHNLRCEIIEKSVNLWQKEESWQNRHKVFEIMKKNYDINLYHENK